MSTADAADGVNITGTVTVLIIHVFLSYNDAAAAGTSCHLCCVTCVVINSSSSTSVYGWDHTKQHCSVTAEINKRLFKTLII
jgi:hypothetical protein